MQIFRGHSAVKDSTKSQVQKFCHLSSLGQHISETRKNLSLTLDDLTVTSQLLQEGAEGRSQASITADGKHGPMDTYLCQRRIAHLIVD